MQSSLRLRKIVHLCQVVKLYLCPPCQTTIMREQCQKGLDGVLGSGMTELGQGSIRFSGQVTSERRSEYEVRTCGFWESRGISMKIVNI